MGKLPCPEDIDFEEVIAYLDLCWERNQWAGVKVQYHEWAHGFSCPHDSFVWLALYLALVSRFGDTPEYVMDVLRFCVGDRWDYRIKIIKQY